MRKLALLLAMSPSWCDNSAMNVWRLVAHHEDAERVAKWDLKHGVVGLGWSKIGDLRAYKSADAIHEAVVKAYPDNRNRHRAHKHLLQFRDSVVEGDLIILSTGKRRVKVVRVTGPYQFDPDWESNGVYGNQRSVTLTAIDPDQLWIDSGGRADGENKYAALLRCKHSSKA